MAVCKSHFIHLQQACISLPPLLLHFALPLQSTLLTKTIAIGNVYRLHSGVLLIPLVVLFAAFLAATSGVPFLLGNGCRMPADFDGLQTLLDSGLVVENEYYDYQREWDNSNLDDLPHTDVSGYELIPQLNFDNYYIVRVSTYTVGM